MRTATTKLSSDLSDGQFKKKTEESLTPQRYLSGNKRFGADVSIIRKLIAGMAVLGSLVIFGESWYLLFVLVVVVIYVCSEILVDHLPWSLSSAMKRNCIRQDGSWSKKRERTELFAMEKLRWNVRITLLLVLIPTTILTYLVDQTIVPIRIGFTGLVSLRATPEKTKANLTEVEIEFEKSQPASLINRFFGMDVETQKRMLWNAWPFALIGAAFWLAGCCVAIKKSYLHQLKEFSDGVKFRGIEYIQFDRGQGL